MANNDAKLRLTGNSNTGIVLRTVTDFGTASANAGIGSSIKGTGFSLGAKASAYSARSTVQFTLFGRQIEIGVTADVASFGADMAAMYTSGKGLEVKGSVSAFLGIGFIFRIK